MITLNLLTLSGAVFASKKIKLEDMKVGTKRSLRKWADKQDLKYGAYLGRQFILPEGMTSGDIK